MVACPLTTILYLFTSSCFLRLRCEKLKKLRPRKISQFLLIGTSEILASITSLEFFYSQAPSATRIVTQSLNLATSAVGSFVVIPLLYIVNSNPHNEWVPVNVDDGHLDYYFLVLAALMGANLVVFYYVATKYNY